MANVFTCSLLSAFLSAGPWAYVTPKATLWSSQYKLDDQVAGESDSISRTVGVFSVDSGLSFERTVNESGMIQTLEPRLFALYVPEEDQTAIPNFDTAEYSFTYSSLFRENRFSGYDKIGDTQQLTLGLSSGFYRSNGSEVARMGIAQAHYFADREVQLESTTAADTSKRSNVALEASWNVTDALRISNDSELDASDYHLIENNLKFSYSPNVNKVFTLGFPATGKTPVSRQTCHLSGRLLKTGAFWDTGRKISGTIRPRKHS